MIDVVWHQLWGIATHRPRVGPAAIRPSMSTLLTAELFWTDGYYMRVEWDPAGDVWNILAYSYGYPTAPGAPPVTMTHIPTGPDSHKN